MSRVSSGIEWGDIRSGDTGQGLQKEALKIWEQLAMGSQGREEEGIPNNSRTFGLGDAE